MHHKNMITLFSLEISADSDIETAMLNTVVYTDTRTSLDDKIQLAIKWNQQNVVDRLLVLKQARLLSLPHPRPQAGASVVSVSPSSSSRRASVVSVSPSSSSRRASVVPAVRGACACLTLVLKQATYHAYSYWSLTDTIYQEAASTVRAQGTPGRSSYR